MSHPQHIHHHTSTPEEHWRESWLNFPTVGEDKEGRWHFWSVPADTGVFQVDFPEGEKLANATIKQMREFPEGASVLRRILRDMDSESNVAQGFTNRLEDLLTYPEWSKP